MKILSEEINSILLKSGFIGGIMGILTILLADEHLSFKQKIKETVSAIFFAIFSGFVMNHLILTGKATQSLEWAVIGFVSYNQKSLKALFKLSFNALVSKPFDTLKQIKDIFKP